MSKITAKQWLIEAAKNLREAYVEHPHLVAEIILSKAINLDRAMMIAHSDENLNEDVEKVADELLEKRVSGIPLSYVLEETEFFSLKIRVTPSVLVPEAETEHLVQAVLDIAQKVEYKDKEKIGIADVGTGSGCIIAAIAVNDARFVGVGIDVSGDALEIAEQNLRQHNVLDRFQLIQSDIFNSVPKEIVESDAKFDFIVSNPPYIAEGERETLRKEVLTQPEVSLFGGIEGTEFTKKLILQSIQRLKQPGYLIIEIGQGTHDEIIEFARLHELEHIKTINDYTNIERILVFQYIKSR